MEKIGIRAAPVGRLKEEESCAHRLSKLVGHCIAALLTLRYLRLTPMRLPEGPALRPPPDRPALAKLRLARHMTTTKDLSAVLSIVPANLQNIGSAGKKPVLRIAAIFTDTSLYLGQCVVRKILNEIQNHIFDLGGPEVRTVVMRGETRQHRSNLFVPSRLLRRLPRGRRRELQRGSYRFCSGFRLLGFERHICLP